MAAAHSIEDAIAAHYGNLSLKLQTAADYVVSHPIEIATRSLRSVASSSGVSPSTFSRLARALGYDTYEELREVSRHTVGRKILPFAEKARRLQDESRSDGQDPFLLRHSTACVANIETQMELVDPARLEAVVDAIARARNVVLIGALGSAGILDHIAYVAGWIAANWRVVGKNGAALAPSLSNLGPDDVVLVLSMAPHAKRSMTASEIAAEAGATVVVISDNHACPAFTSATHSFVVPTESPQFFSSYTATLVLLETLVGMLVARAGQDPHIRIREVERLNARLQESSM